MHVARCTWDDNVEGRSGVAPGPAAGTVAKGMRREGLKVARCTLHVGRQRGRAQRRCARTGGGDSGAGDEARGVEGCTLHVARGTTTWRGAAALRPDRQRGQWREARRARGRKDAGAKVTGCRCCTLHVDRGKTEPLPLHHIAPSPRRRNVAALVQIGAKKSDTRLFSLLFPCLLVK